VGSKGITGKGRFWVCESSFFTAAMLASANQRQTADFERGRNFGNFEGFLGEIG
jgi:hypothetical protein